MNIPKNKFIPIMLAENIEAIEWLYFENNNIINNKNPVWKWKYLWIFFFVN